MPGGQPGGGGMGTLGFDSYMSFVQFDEREFLPEVKLYDVRRALGVNFSRYVLATTATTQRINAPPIFSLMTSNLASL